MATKTISVDLEAYDRLLRAKTSSRESFSQVIKRAEWPVGEGTARSMLEFTRGLYRERGALSDEVLAGLDEAQESDGVSPDPWEK